MWLFLTEHAYLWVVLTGLPMVAVGLSLAGPHRRPALWAGLVMVALLPASLLHGDYWHPPRIGGWALGIEDILCAFSLGAGAYLAAAAWLPRPQRPVTARLFTRRLLVFLAPYAVLTLAFHALGSGSVEAAIGAQAAMIVTGLAWNRTLRRPMLLATAAYVPYYLLILLAGHWATGDFLACWDGRSLWPGRLGPMPVQEITWVVCFVPAWTAACGYALAGRGPATAMRSCLKRSGRQRVARALTAGMLALIAWGTMLRLRGLLAVGAFQIITAAVAAGLVACHAGVALRPRQEGGKGKGDRPDELAP